MILSRRSFLKKLGFALVGGLIVSPIPKTFYSFPKTLLTMTVPELEAYLSAELAKRFHDDFIDRVINGDPTFYSEFGEPLGILSLEGDVKQ